MKKILVILFCFYIYKSNTLQNIISNSDNKTNIYQTFLSLEDKYDDKMLRSYNINPDDLRLELSQIKGEKAKEDYKREYIMEKANISESEYQDRFVHPVSQIKQTSSESIEDIKKAYEYIETKVESIENLLDLFKNN